MAVACIALAVALGGTSYAAIKLPRNSVGTVQLKKNAVTSPKVKNNALTSADIKETTLGRVLLAALATTATTATNAAHATTADSAAPPENGCGSIIITLPVGYRPVTDLGLPVIRQDSVGGLEMHRVNVEANGSLVLTFSCANTNPTAILSLGAVTFRAA
jgi:hypothetical protein